MNKLPKDFDSVDLFYAAHALCTYEPLHKSGLTRAQQKRAKKAGIWFVKELRSAVSARIKRLKKK